MNKKKKITYILVLIILLIFLFSFVQALIFQYKTKLLIESSYNNYGELPQVYEEIISERDFLYLTREQNVKEYIEEGYLIENYSLNYIYAIPSFNKIYVFFEDNYQAKLNNGNDIRSLPSKITQYVNRRCIVIWKFDLKNCKWKIIELKVPV